MKPANIKKIINSKLPILIFIAIFIVLIAAISTLDSDVETLSKQETLSKAQEAIVLNQVGYLPQWQKTAFVVNNQSSISNIELINNDTKELVATLTLGETIEDESTSNRLSPVDFTSVKQPGKYYLKQDKLQSVPFEIGTDIYQQPLVSLLRSYYLQRCGVEINDPVTGISHAPCHIKDGLIARQDPYHEANEAVEATGGWHNGEGYSKYATTTAVSIARLLDLYEQHPDLFPDNQLDIRESGNGVADLLDEMKFGLDWLLKMQRPDGAIYRKVAGKTWVLNLPPEEDILPRYIYGISTEETAKFAAVMAIASRNFQSVDAQLATKYLDAAELAWQYLQTQPEINIDWIDTDDTGSLSYVISQFNQDDSLKTDLDDRLWAAVELYITTGKQDFNNYFTTNLDLTYYDGVFGWKNPLSLALTDYIEQNKQPTSEEVTSKIKTAIVQQAETILNRVQQSPYKIANDRFIEGSNKITIEEGITLVHAYQLSKNKAYLTAAIDQLDYILGRNYFNQTFVTGIGTNPVENVNYIGAIASQVNLPGLLVGGPNGDTLDGLVARNQGQLSYVDEEGSYNTNQYTIDNNASLISLITNLIVQQ